ncbi:FAD-dependent oxidoreductase [Nocardia seriolae]|uniref:FAD-dependent monooxygenase n=1 Tax=Nocardia seriolae TaxID=37332 RepID=UPI0012BC2221|nr:FAD-dependent monooxygenase [Nocardia seriolae]MTK31915.1 FAD-dependent oxidoreductase [Nocardia seriolae]
MVTIIGGGVAGSALAGALARHGTPVTLYERQPKPQGGGAFLFIDGRGHRALTALGVDESALRAASYPLTGGLEYTDSAGHHGATPGQGHRFWLRRNLMAILTDFVTATRAETRFATAVPALAALHDDRIIAADGVDSTVRAHLQPDRTPQYAGDVVLYGMTTEPLTLPTTPATLHFFAELSSTGNLSSTLGHIWRPGDPTALWFLRLPRPPLPGSDDLSLRPVGEWADRIRTATPNNRALIDRFLATTESVHVSNARNVPLDTAAPPTDSTLLIGDADHAITPAAGIGARDALEDAQAVYRALVSGTSPALAMAARRRTILAERETATRARQAVQRGPHPHSTE